MSLRWFAKHKENIESVTAVNIMTQAETKKNIIGTLIDCIYTDLQFKPSKYA